MSSKLDSLLSKLESYDLVDRSYTARIINLSSGLNSDRCYKIYWGVAPTDCININHLVPLIHIARFVKAGCRVKILIADLHAYLERHISHQVLGLKSNEYAHVIRKILKKLNVDMKMIDFVVGASFQLRPEYSLDVMRIQSNTSIDEAISAGLDVLVRGSGNESMTHLVYPIMQALDEHYMEVDAHFGDVNQVKIMEFANKKLETIGYRRRDHLIFSPVFDKSKTDLSKSGEMALRFDKSSIETINHFSNEQLDEIYVKIITPILELKSMNVNGDKKKITIDILNMFL